MRRRTRGVKKNENQADENKIITPPSTEREEDKHHFIIRPPEDTQKNTPMNGTHRPIVRRRRIPHEDTKKQSESENDEVGVEKNESKNHDFVPEEEEKPSEKKSEVLSSEQKEDKHEIQDSSEENSIPENKEIVFKCTRERTMTTETFTFSTETEVLFKAKTKSTLGEKKIFINNGDDVHIKGLHDYTMIVSSFCRSYKVYKSTEQESFIDVTVNPVSTPIPYERFFTLTVTSESGERIELKTEMPHLNQKGNYVLSFGPIFIINSIKNAILIDHENKRRIMVIKIGDDILNIKYFEGSQPIEPIVLFAFAIISWTCPH